MHSRHSALLTTFAVVLTLFVAFGSVLSQPEVTLQRITYASDSLRRSELTGFGSSTSCDGARIAFISTSDFHNEGLGLNKYLWLYDDHFTSFTRLTPQLSTDDFSDQPSMSADGTKISFYSDNDFRDQGIVDSQHEIWLATTTDQVALTRLTTSTHGIWTNRNPSISADGTKVAFVGNHDFFNDTYCS